MKAHGKHQIIHLGMMRSMMMKTLTTAVGKEKIMMKEKRMMKKPKAPARVKITGQLSLNKLSITTYGQRQRIFLTI